MKRDGRMSKNLLTAIASKDLVIIAMSMLIATMTVISWNKPKRVRPVVDVIPKTLLLVSNDFSSVKPNTDQNRLVNPCSALY